MAKTKAETMWSHFESLEDPRDAGRNTRHLLKDIIVMVVVGYCCGMKSLEACAHFAVMQESWFQKFLELPNGVPSHDTFRRVFSLIDVEAFGRCFTSWTSVSAPLREGDIVPIDGKTIRRSGGKGERALHVVSAWSQANGLVLGQVSAEEKSNEITAIPKLIESLCIEGCTVTIDAMGCQTAIADAIIEKGAHYILAVKDNQPSLHAEIQSHFDGAPPESVGGEAMKVHEESDKGHGRIETRKIFVSGNIEALVEAERWSCIASVIRVNSTRTLKEQTSVETRHFISSLPADDAKKFLDAIRGHWEIENKLHWCLDVTFGEDSALLRSRQLAENGSTVRRIALNSLRSHPDFKGNLARATRAAAFDHGFREKLMKSIVSNA